MQYVRYILLAIVVMLLQLLLFNNLHFLGICHPFVYVIILLCLPMNLPRWGELLIGAGVGLIADMVCSSPGVHTAASVLIAYLRPMVVSRMVQDAERLTENVSGATVGKNIFWALTAILVPVHHLVVFLLEYWSFSQLGWVLLATLLSSLLTVLIVIILDLVHQ